MLGHFLSAKNFLNDKNDFSWIYLNAKSGVFLLPRTVLKFSVGKQIEIYGLLGVAVAGGGN